MVGASISCKALLTPEHVRLSVFVAGLLDIWYAFYERSMSGGADLIVPWYGGIPTMFWGETLAAWWLYEPKPTTNQHIPHIAGRGSTGMDLVSVPGLLELWICGRISNLEMGPYCPRVSLAP